MTAHTAALAAPIVVFTDTARCDGLHEAHDHAIATDGQSAYIYPVDDRALIGGDTTAVRAGVCITAVCRQMVGDAECLGSVTFHLDTPGGWGTDADARGLLAAYGTGVES